MSASTVSVTANPSSRRRTAVVIGERKTGLDLTGSDGIAVHSPASVGGGIEIGKDLSHSMRGGETVVVVKKALPPNSTTTTTTPRGTGTRKGSAPKPPKPRWKTVVSVFSKNFALLIILYVLAQMIRRFALDPRSYSGGPGSTPSPADYDYERRIAEVEAFLKTTTKMMQVQVEVVDRKIESEIAGLRNELGKNIEDSASQLRKFDSRVERLEKSFSSISADKWLAKDEFDNFLEEFKKEGNRGGDVDLDLDEVRAFARAIVEKEIEKHAADGLGRVDYALYSGGGMVVKHSEPFVTGRNWLKWSRVHHDAVKMLTPSFGEPGVCFPLKGSSGFVHVKLKEAIIPEAVTLEHVAKSVAYDRTSAPKDCKVFGWFRGQDTADPLAGMDNMRLLMEFTYDLEKSSAQTWNVLNGAGSGLVNMIRLELMSNHGHPDFTCIYRLRVHGHEPDPTPSLSA